MRRPRLVVVRGTEGDSQSRGGVHDWDSVKQAFYSGERAAVEVVSNVIRSVCAQYVPHEDAADLVQDTLAAIFAADRKDAVNFAGYIRTAARNRVVDFWRKKRPHLFPGHEADEIAGSAGFDLLDKGRLFSAIDRLPPKTRRALQLELSGKPPGDIAEELGVAASSVRRLLSDARRELHARLLG